MTVAARRKGRRSPRQLRRAPGTPEAAAIKPTMNPAALAAGLPAPAPAVRVLASGIDTLHLFCRAGVNHLHVRELEAAQEEARAWRAEGHHGTGPTLQVGPHVLEVQPHGARTAPFLLRQEDVLDVLVAPQAAPGFPTWMCELRALHLWGLGVDAAVADAEKVAASQLTQTTAEDRNMHVSRVDLAVDFQGWTPAAREGFADQGDEAVVRYVCRAHDFAAYSHRRAFTGFHFGRGDVTARLYDKTAEAKRSGKLTAMQRVWSKNDHYDPAAPVWRLEFQLRREAIAALRLGKRPEPGEPDLGGEVSTWPQLRRTLRGLWAHLATRWLARRAPRTKTSRQPTTPEWSALAGAGFLNGPWTGTDTDLHRARREELAERMTPQLTGYLARALAEEVYFAPGRALGEVSDVDLEGALPAIVRRVRAHTEKRSKRGECATLEERAARKVAHWDDAKMAAALAPSPSAAVEGTDDEDADP